VTYQTKLIAGGKMAIPAALRRELGLDDGSELLIEKDGDGFRVYTRASAIRALQRMMAPYRIEGVSVVDELIAERRAESARD
jgi:bifunctional DNA-binding transcriptional regulator/antitoxin component of YhaV-PrlF toxin-antitoxin module